MKSAIFVAIMQPTMGWARVALIPRLFALMSLGIISCESTRTVGIGPAPADFASDLASVSGSDSSLPSSDLTAPNVGDGSLPFDLAITPDLASASSDLADGLDLAASDLAPVSLPFDPAASRFLVLPLLARADGADAVVIIADVRATGGVPLAGVALAIAVTGTENDLSPTEPQTDATGRAVIHLRSTRAESKAISVSAGGDSLGPPVVVQFQPAIVDRAKSRVEVDPPFTPADGLSAATVRLFARDALDQPVMNVPVAALMRGRPSSLSPGPTLVTNAQGEALWQVRARTEGGRRLEVSSGGHTWRSIVRFSSVAPAINTAPIARSTGGCVALDYSVAHTASRPVDVRMQFNDGSGWRSATQGADSFAEGTFRLSTQPEGAAHRFRWNSTRDLPLHNGPVNVRVRATAGNAIAYSPPGLVQLRNGPRWDRMGAPTVSDDWRSVLQVDLDRDGQLDLVFRSMLFVRVVLNEHGAWRALPDRFILSPNDYTAAVAAGDFDRDGLVDLVVAGEWERSLLRGRGDGTFDAATTITVKTTSSFEAAMAGDLDHDGALDLVFVSSGAGVTQLGDGSGGFGPAQAMPFGLGDPELLDMDHDGLLDLIGTAAGVGLVLRTGNGDGSFGPQQVLVGGNLKVWTRGDFDRDGRAELLVGEHAGPTGYRAGLYEGSPSVGYTLRTTFALTSNSKPTVVDLDGDAAPDVLWAMTYDSDGLFNDGIGDLTPAPRVTPDMSRDQFIAGDFDADGDADVLYVAPIQATRTNDQLAPCELRPDAVTTYGTFMNLSASPRYATPADLDLDGKLDVLTNGLLFLGDGSGFVGAPFAQYPGLGDGIAAMEVADVNHDGLVDLIAAKSDGTLLARYASLPGWFSGGVTIPTTTGVIKLLAGSFDEDGRTDLLTMSPTAGALQLLAGTSADLASPVSYWQGPVQAATSADLDLDGVDDVVVGTSTGELRRVQPGAAPLDELLATGDPIRAVVVLDANGDGTLDVISATASGLRFTFGAGLWQKSSETVLPTPIGNLNSLEVADVDGDDQMDVVLNKGMAVWSLNTGFVVQPTPGGARPEILGDADGDGRADAMWLDQLLHVSSGRSDLRFATPSSVTQDANVLSAIGVEDLDDDGRLDVLFMRFVAPGVQEVVVARGLPLGFAPIVAVSPNLLGAGEVVLVDLNADGRRDLLVLGSNADTYLRVGALFTYASTWAKGPGATTCVGDLNRDGRPDLVAGTTPPTIANGDGSGGFIPVPWPSSGYDCAVADFDRDGRPDVVLLMGSWREATVWRGDGAGGFLGTVGPSGGTSRLVANVRALDLNGDGIADLDGDDSNGIHVNWYGVGNGTFTDGLGCAAVADFLGNGRRTCLEPTRENNLIGQLKVRDLATGRLVATLRTGSPTTFLVGDFDRDGREDFTNGASLVLTR